MLKQFPMLRYVLQKGFWYILTFIVAVAINFTLPRLGENNPVDIIMGKAAQGLSPEEAQKKKESLLVSFGMAELNEDGSVIYEQIPELDNNGKPVLDSAGAPVVKKEPKLASGFSQFVSYIKNVFKGDLGLSYSQYPKPVIDIIKESIPWTLAIQAPTILLGWIVGNLLGAFAAYKRGIFDKVFFPLAMFLNGVPYFVFGMLLVALFSITLGWFPAMGAYGPDLIPGFNFAFIKSVGYYYVLPFFSCFPILLAGQATGMRSMSIYELGTDYMKYAKWLGLREGKIIGYVFRNAMLPQLTGLAQSLGSMVGGALITEMIFSYPGLGMAMLTAIQQNDYATIQGCTLMISTCVLIANFAVDVLIAVFDPRVKAGLQMGGK
ncbi:MAG: ABC transporter permease [Fibrobacteraceae bacterium]|nr:ABC transporter permease [Fibrobacteraceae bacterium]